MSLNTKFLGQADFILNEKSITSSLPEKAVGLLCYLMMNPNKIHYREQLSDMFWGDSHVYSSSNNLRYTLWILRKNLEFDKQGHRYIINLNKNSIKFNENTSDSMDVFQFRALYNQSKKDLNLNVRINIMKEACMLYRGIFLEDFYLKDAPAFNDWVFFEREELQRQYFDVQINLSKEYEKLGLYNEAIKTLERLIKVDFLNENLYCQLINLYSKSGHRTMAIEVYQKLKKTLREEFNISPNKKAQSLFQQICMEEDKALNKQVNLPQISASFWGNEPKQFVSIQKSGLHMQFFITESAAKKDELSTVFNKVKSENTLITIEITKCPGKRVPYEGFYEILEGYRNLISQEKELTDKDKIITEIDNIKLNSSIGKYALFQNLCSIFNMTKEMGMMIIIYNFHLLDDATIDFISFLTRKCREANIQILGLHDSAWESERFELFKKEFLGEKIVEFINA